MTIETTSRRRGRWLKTTGVSLVALGLSLGTMTAAHADTITIGTGGTSESYTRTQRTLPTQFQGVGGGYEKDEWGYQIAHASNNRTWTSSTHQFQLGGGGWQADSSTLNAYNSNTGAWVKSIKVPKIWDNGASDVKVAAAYGLAVEDDDHAGQANDPERHRLWTSSTRDDRVIVYEQSASGQLGNLPDVPSPKPTTPTLYTGSLPSGVAAVIDGVEHPRDILIDKWRNTAFVSDPWGKIYEFDTRNFSTKVIIQTSNPNFGSALGNFSPMSLDGEITSSVSKFYTVNLNDGKVFEFNHASPSFKELGNVGSGNRGSGIAVNPTNDKVYVATQGTNPWTSGSSKLVTFDRTVTTPSSPLVTQPYGVAQLNVAVDLGNHLTTDDRVYTAAFGGTGVAIADSSGTAINAGGSYLLNLDKTGDTGHVPNDVAVHNGKLWVLDRHSTAAQLHVITKP